MMIIDRPKVQTVPLRTGTEIEVLWTASYERDQAFYGDPDGWEYFGSSIQWEPNPYGYDMVKIRVADAWQPDETDDDDDEEYDATLVALDLDIDLSEDVSHPPITVNNLLWEAWRISTVADEIIIALADGFSLDGDDFRFTIAAQFDDGAQGLQTVLSVPRAVVKTINMEAGNRYKLGPDPYSIQVDEIQDSFRDLGLSPDGEQCPL